MRDVTADLVSAGSRRRDKWGSETDALFSKTAAAIAGQVEWDAGAGEDWARVFDASDELVAYVYALAPLVIGLRNASLSNALPSDATLVEVTDLDAPELCAEPVAMVSLFGDEVLDGEFRPEAFSAEELWFWTV